jgi:uncharacterized protein YigE (DUF2233 family)
MTDWYGVVLTAPYSKTLIGEYKMRIDSRFVVNSALASSVTAQAAGDVNGAEFDMLGTVGAAVQINVTDAATSVTVKLQHSDTSGSGYVDCASDEVAAVADGDTTVVATEAGEYAIGYTGTKQYVRAVATVVGADAAFDMINIIRPQFSADSLAIPDNTIA